MLSHIKGIIALVMVQSKILAIAGSEKSGNFGIYK